EIDHVRFDQSREQPERQVGQRQLDHWQHSPVQEERSPFEETSAQYATPAIPATGFGASRLSNAGKRVAGRRGVRRRTEIGGPPGGPSAPEGLRSSRPYVRNCFPAILGSMQTAMIDRIAAAPYDLLRRNRVPM